MVGKRRLMMKNSIIKIFVLLFISVNIGYSKNITDFEEIRFQFNKWQHVISDSSYKRNT